MFFGDQRPNFSGHLEFLHDLNLSFGISARHPQMRHRIDFAFGLFLLFDETLVFVPITEVRGVILPPERHSQDTACCQRDRSRQQALSKPLLLSIALEKLRIGNLWMLLKNALQRIACWAEKHKSRANCLSFLRFCCLRFTLALLDRSHNSILAVIDN